MDKIPTADQINQRINDFENRLDRWFDDVGVQLRSLNIHTIYMNHENYLRLQARMQNQTTIEDPTMSYENVEADDQTEPS